MKRGTCEFCGRTGVWLDKEHVWSWWLSRAVLGDANAPRIRVVRAGLLQERPLHRQHRKSTEPRLFTVDLEVFMACRAHCNGGWMKQLEDGVLPFLKPMAVEGRASVLSRDEAITLAAWATKTAMVYEYMDSGSDHYSGGPERKHLATYLRPPDGTSIWMFRYEGYRHTAAVPRRYIGGRDYGADGVLIVSGYSLTLTAGQFGIQVLHFRGPDWQSSGLLRAEPGTYDAALVPLWPCTDYPVRWPAVAALDDGEFESLATRFTLRT